MPQRTLLFFGLHSSLSCYLSHALRKLSLLSAALASTSAPLQPVSHGLTRSITPVAATANIIMASAAARTLLASTPLAHRSDTDP